MNFKLTLLIFVFLSCFLIVGAKDQSIQLTYSFENASLVEKSIDFSSLLIKISTEVDATCKYDTDKGTSYASMDGFFDLTSGKIHEKSFVSLGNGIYKYYILCYDGNIIGKEMEVIIRANPLVTAHIVIGEESPIKEGKYELNLITSEIVTQSPSLSYSFDGTVYEQIPLTGSEKKYKGHLIISSGTGEKTVSFKFKANDLEGREGSEIISGGAFLVDTVKPGTISSFKATGYKGKIDLEWDFDDNDIKDFKIYRSTSPNLDTTDFYSTVSKSPFIDTSVSDGQTYYYRVTAVDNAGNEGSLSLEMYATALLSESSSSSSFSGLELKPLGKVDNLLKNIELTTSEVDSIKSAASLKTGKEKEIFDKLKLASEIDSAISELNSLKKEVEKYKLQDLSEEELDNKISSSEVKLSIIKKKVPENLILLGEESIEENVESKEVEEAILEINPDILQKTKDKSTKESMRIIEDSEMKITSYFYVAQILYMEGTKRTVSIVDRQISSKLEEIEWSGDGDFIESIPKDIAESASQIKTNSVNYRIVKEDPIISFGADTKEIFYYFDKELSISSLKNIDVTFVSIYEEEIGTGVTGYFSFDFGDRSYLGLFIGLIVVAVLFVYFVYLRKNKDSSAMLQIRQKIKESKDFLKNGQREKARDHYSFIKNAYNNLDKKEMKKTYRKILSLHKKLGRSK